MQALLQYAQQHSALTHVAVLALGGLLGRQVFAFIENHEDAILAKGLALQRAKLTAIGATPEQIAAFDAHEALILQKASEAFKADASKP